MGVVVVLGAELATVVMVIVVVDVIFWEAGVRILKITFPLPGVPTRERS